MGTRILGSQTTGPSSLAYWLNPTSNSNIKADNPVFTMPEDGYIDSIRVYARTQNGSAATALAALYNPANNYQYCKCPLFTLGGSIGWAGQGFSTPYPFIANGSQVQGAIWTNTNGLEIYAVNNGGNFEFLQSTYQLPNPWPGGTVKNAWGGLGWYATYFPVAAITSLSASGGTQGQSVTINGQSFSSGISSVDFNGTGASYTYVNDTQIVATIPNGATSGPIHVVTNAGTATSGTFYINPVITSISPTSGNPGTGVTIDGTGFTGVQASNGGSLSFTNASATYTVNSDTQISTSVPAGAVTGPITAYGGNGSYQSQTFTVTTSITGFSPTSGGAGTAVTITGTGFTGATDVKFNGTSVSSFTVNSDTQISTTVPSGATSGPISVVGTGGTATSSTSFVVAPGWFKASGTVQRLKGMWYKSGGVLQPIKGGWYKSGGTLHPLK